MLKLRKTPANQRQTYTYEFANGDRVILEPGKATIIRTNHEIVVQVDASITELTIKNLHRDDDKEVYINLKQINCEDSATAKERIANMKKWAEEHPYEPDERNPYFRPKKNISFDSVSDDDEFSYDKSKLLYDAVMYQESLNADPYVENREIVREYVKTLPSSMQELYEFLYIKEMTQAEICKELGLSKGTVSERVKTLNEKILKHFKENPNF